MAKNRIYIPTFISSVNYAPARVLPHIYFYNGVKACETYYVQGYFNGNTGSVISTPLEGFPYFDNYEGQDPTSGSRSLLFFNEPAVYGTTPTGSLYTEYWENYINLLYNPRTRLVNCEGIIPLADYFKMELNDIVEWRGNYYHLRAINNYNLKNGECQLQLLGPILGDILPNIIPAIACDFTFTSSVITTTTTTTAAPTTTTTTAATTTTTTTPFSCSNCTSWTYNNNFQAIDGTILYYSCITGESQLIYVPGDDVFGVTGSFCNCNSVGTAYQIIGTGFTLTNTSASCNPTSTTTTLAPTTTTTTLSTASCNCTLFVAGGAGGTATWTECSSSAQSQALSGNETLLVCAASGSEGLTGASSLLVRGNQIPANPLCNTSSSVSCLPSASCICVTLTQGNESAGTYVYHDCASNSIIAGTLAKNDVLKVCAVSGSWVALGGGGASITYGAACTSSASCV
jgi:hypothetical protein